jgi:sterol desaturase/sphingolipid hydroxylase (fatty acid hydroxylase superfamily)
MSDSAIRLTAFFSIFILMALLEAFLPRRERNFGRVRRWGTNWSMTILNSVVGRLMVFIAPFEMALWASEQQFGLLNLFSTPTWLAIIISVIVLDFAIWFQHWVVHKIPLLWLFHKVHHADRDLDVTSGARFHPVEIALSLIYKAALVLLLGTPAAAVLIFDIVLNGMAMFNHANFNIPQGIEKYLRLLVVTPDVHRVHHSTRVQETNSNYGFNLSIWDRLFGTYCAQPKLGHDGMTVGLDEYQDDGPTKLSWSLLLPFSKAATVSADQKKL